VAELDLRVFLEAGAVLPFMKRVPPPKETSMFGSGTDLARTV
jgi:hypothetical protein